MQERQQAQLDRCYLPEPHLRKGQTYTFSAEETKHLHSLRLQSGDAIEVVNGKGALATAVLSAIGRRDAAVRSTAGI